MTIQKNNDEVFKNIQSQLDNHQKKLKRESQLLSYLFVIGGLILLIAFDLIIFSDSTVQFQQSFYEKHFLSLIFFPVFVIMPYFMPKLVPRLLKVTIDKEFGIVEVSGNLSTQTITRLTTKTSTTDEEFIYLTNMTSTVPVPSDIIYNKQHKVIKETLNWDEPITCNVALLIPSPTLGFMNKYHRQGYLALLPYEKYTTDNDGFLK